MNDEVAAHFRAVRSLRAALIVTVAREVPVAVWQRYPAAKDAAASAAHATRAHRSLAAALGRMGFAGAPGRLTVELDDAVAMYTPVRAGLSGLFVFAADTPLGLVRLHVDRLSAQVRDHFPPDAAIVEQGAPAGGAGEAGGTEESPPEAPDPVRTEGPEGAPASEGEEAAPAQPARIDASPAGPSTDPMRPDRVPRTARYDSEPPSGPERQAPAERASSDRPPRSKTDVPMAPGREEPAPRSRTDVPMAPRAGSAPVAKKTLTGTEDEGDDAPGPESAPVSVPRPPHMPTGTDPPPPPDEGVEGDAGDAPEASLEKTRGERLLEHLERYAPDAHAALLRVSLQTGLPMALLRTPERMSDDEVEQVEASVKRILGTKDLSY